MAVPKRKTSKSRKNMRRAHDTVTLPGITTCPQCHEPVLPHHVCRECGNYKGRTVLKIEES
jgi:large subunit ribosomal protein L32